MDSVIDRYSKFWPQVAYVLLAGWALVADRLGAGGPLDGVTLVAAVYAVVQALAVVLPGNPTVKTVLSLATAVLAAVTAGFTDGWTSGELALVFTAFLTWGASAAATNTPAFVSRTASRAA